MLHCKYWNLSTQMQVCFDYSGEPFQPLIEKSDLIRPTQIYEILNETDGVASA